MKKINLIVEKTSTGFSAYAENYPVYTVGASMTELKSNILEAMNLYQEETGGEPVKESDINITLDLPQFFEYFKVINAKALSERVGMNQSLLAQYVGGQKKPSSKQVEKILLGIRELGKELSELQLG
ncbi:MULTISPECIES: helix-turn-helix transcriptional regulator [Mucilaginibacter]|uniref:XRE family transcriptional regulator n=1 Tax=Mucilaginibacter gilvus TaxID=2305909 RepID=A0A444MMZ8_9SPHI|nr:helix-turn-helix transcriptional regulator [Mucilaginibacter gilvus]RWY51091.1 XRE family transcriptional regulator [Mucilaginibacter gilvus]